MIPDSLIFDMDGTLWDGVEAYAEGFNQFFIANSIPRRITKKDIFMYMGLEEKEYLAKTLPEFPEEERSVNYNKIIEYQYQKIHEIGGTMYDGVFTGLKELSKKYKIFIVSNCPKDTIKHFMQWAHIQEYITDTISHGMNFKPKHANIQLLINKHNLQTPMYFGDTDSDRKQCEIANIPFAFVSYGFGHANTYNLKFDSFNQLSSYFLSL